MLRGVEPWQIKNYFAYLCLLWGQMNEKLNYLELLKNNMGEEMAEMMSEEITKVMDEQRMIEMEYARLVQQRDQLKGITNKNQLEETKREIMVSTLPSPTVHQSVTVLSDSNRLQPP